MRTLLRTTASLLRKYPILWLPVALADVTSFCLRILQSWTTQVVIRNLVVSHSVLTNAPEPLRTLPTTWATVFGVARFLVEYLHSCVYTTAMIAVCALIPALITKSNASWQYLLIAVKQSGSRILLFSLQAFALLVVAAILGIWLIAYSPGLHSTWIDGATISPNQGIVLQGLLFAVAAWLIAPAAVNLLKSRESPPTELAPVRLARNSAALAVVTSVAIFLITKLVEPNLIQRSTPAVAIQIFWGLASLISAIPYVPLFVALSLIASPSILQSSVPDEPPAASALESFPSSEA